MAISISEDDHRWIGNQRVVTVDITLDASYPTGGEAVSASDVGLGAIENVDFPGGANTGGYVPVWDDANGKLQMFEAGADGTPLDEVADTTDLSAETVTVRYWGRS